MSRVASSIKSMLFLYGIPNYHIVLRRILGPYSPPYCLARVLSSPHLKVRAFWMAWRSRWLSEESGRNHFRNSLEDKGQRHSKEYRLLRLLGLYNESKIHLDIYSETPLKRPPLGKIFLAIIEGWPYLRGFCDITFVTNSLHQAPHNHPPPS